MHKKRSEGFPLYLVSFQDRHPSYFLSDDIKISIWQSHIGQEQSKYQPMEWQVCKRKIKSVELAKGLLGLNWGFQYKLLQSISFFFHIP